MTASPVSAVSLRALQGAPLADKRICEMVVATANSIAERQGVKIISVQTSPDRIIVTLNVGRLASVGFAAELRRLTTRWYTQKYHEPTLWGEPVEEGDEWKQG